MLQWVKSGNEAYNDKIIDLIQQIIGEEIIPAEWELSDIVNYYKEKGDFFNRESCRGVKLTGHSETS